MIGICQKNFMKWEDAIDLAVYLKAQHIELNVDFLGSTEMRYSSHLSNVRKKILQSKLTVSLHSVNGINLCEKVDRLRKVSIQIMKESMDLANYFEAGWITTHLGVVGDLNIEKYNERLNLACESLSELNNHNKNVSICIENLQRYNKAAQKKNLVDNEDDILFIKSYFNNAPINFTIDIGHLNIYNSENQRQKIFSLMLPNAKCVHVHSNNGYEDTHAAFNKLSLRKVSEEAWQCLKSIPICIECYSLNDIKESFKVLKKYEKERCEVI